MATFNVNDKLPPKGSTELRPLTGDGEDEILVFGLQEVGTLRTFLEEPRLTSRRSPKYIVVGVPGQFTSARMGSGDLRWIG
jgi:hypothetical protein